MSDQTKLISFPSHIENLEMIERISAKFAAKAGFDESTVDDISIALTELVNNAIHHANKDDVSKMVTVEFSVNETKLSISIRDEGKGFSKNSLNDPLHPDNLLADNGRGLYLVEALMDEVDYDITETGTEVRIAKHKVKK